ncbi:MAG: hypothetical protein P8Z35_05925 [Ignavibacteriaceae bacterium]
MNSGWTIFSSEKTTYFGDVISKPGFSIKDSYQTNIPKTILAALVENGVYKNPYFGSNLDKIPVEQFQHPWWYRKEFSINETGRNINYKLTLEGVNYKADLWLNGRKVEGKNKIEGPFGIFNFDVRDYLIKGNNIIAIEVFPPEKGDLTIGFVDWNPASPDKNMGLWRGITLKKTNAVSLDEIFIKSKVNIKTLKEAEITISGKLTNLSNEKVNVEVHGSFIKDKNFSKSFLLEAGAQHDFCMMI